MIIELYDIIDKKEYLAHALPPPEGCTLGMIMRHDPKVAEIIPAIHQCLANGTLVTDWESYQPNGDDRIRFELVPHALPAAVVTFIYWAYVVISVALAIYSLYSIFTAPGAAKPKGTGGESGTYAFDGMKNAVEPGGRISVTYGKHRQPGQLLMYYLTMLPERNGLAMSMLLSMGEGPVESVDEVELNEIPFTMLNSVSMETRLGYSSQSIIEGFETIKNTYYDGREISDERELVKSMTACSQIIYRTTGFDVIGIEHFVNAPNGITNIGLSQGTHHGAWVDYTIEYRDAQSDICENPAWSDTEVHRINGKDVRMEWNNAITNFPYASRWDVRFTWVNANRHPARNPERMNGPVNVRIWLQDVTEIRGPSGTFSNEVLLALRAAPSRALQGGRPNATAVLRGRKVDNYSTTTSFVNQWTENPAWPILDYVTNSRYGMGAFVQIGDIDLQSFIDFATLANSSVDVCPETNPETNTTVGKCFGTPEFHHGEPPRGNGGSPATDRVDPYECGEYNSRYDGVNQHGFCRVRQCCDPTDNAPGLFGVQSGEYFCEFQDSWLTHTVITTGSPIFGIIAYMTPESSAETCTAYGMIVDPAINVLALTRWNNQPVNTYGTIVGTFAYTHEQGDRLEFFPEPPHTNSPPWSDHHSRSVLLGFWIQDSAGNTKIFDSSITDFSPDRVDPRTVGIEGLSGVVVLPTPNNRSGDFHSVIVEDFGHACGLCYGFAITEVRTFDMTCRNYPVAASKKQYTFLHKV